MRKMLKSRNLNALLALLLSASLAAFGCTTNRMPGEGEPTRTSPSYAPAATPGTSSGATVEYPPPMMSSATTYDTTYEPMPAVTAAAPARTGKLGLTADQAAAIMGQHQNGGGKFLGYANPGMSGRAYYSDARPTGSFQNPAMVNPQLTINSSISSPGGAQAITSGVGGTGTGVSAAVTTGAVTANAVAAGTTTTTTAAGAAVFPSGTLGVTPTTGAIAVSPTAVAGTVPSPTVLSSSPVVGTATTTTNGTTVSTGTTAAATTVATAPGTTATAPVRLIRTNGRTTVTNQR